MRRQHHPRGFTLLELLVGMAIFTIVLAAVYLVYWTSHTTFTRGRTKIDIQQTARVALETMAREIRMAGYDPSTVIPAQPVGFRQAMQTAGGSDILFIADVEGTGTAQRVRYQLVGSRSGGRSPRMPGGPPGTPPRLANWRIKSKPTTR